MPKISWKVGLTSTEVSRPRRACSGSTSVDFMRENNMVFSLPLCSDRYGTAGGYATLTAYRGCSGSVRLGP